MTRVQGGAGGGVSVNISSGTAHRRPMGSGETTPPPPPHPMGKLIPIRFPLRRRSLNSGTQWRDARGGHLTGPTSGFNLRTAMCKIKL